VTVDRRGEKEQTAPGVRVSFSHIHLFADQLEDLSVYKELENKINLLSQQMNGRVNVEHGRNIWRELHKVSNGLLPVSESTQHESDFISQNRDVVKQLIAGLGFRITAARYPSMPASDDQATDTRSVMVTSNDPNGVQIVVTAIDPMACRKGASYYKHLDSSKVGLKYIFICYYRSSNSLHCLRPI
jgi:hypothetical protein